MEGYAVTFYNSLGSIDKNVIEKVSPTNYPYSQPLHDTKVANPTGFYPSILTNYGDTFEPTLGILPTWIKKQDLS